jgi:hypothetical protein
MTPNINFPPLSREGLEGGLGAFHLHSNLPSIPSFIGGEVLGNVPN